MKSTITRSHYQFVIDEIPQDKLDEFINFMDDFRDETNCRFQYKQGKSVKYPQHIVPQRSLGFPKELDKRIDYFWSKDYEVMEFEGM